MTNILCVICGKKLGETTAAVSPAVYCSTHKQSDVEAKFGKESNPTDEIAALKARIETLEKGSGTK